MNRIASRVCRLERDRPSGRPWWAGLPFDEWPLGAVLAFIGECEGWPPGHGPLDAEWRTLLRDDGQDEAGWDAA